MHDYTELKIRIDGHVAVFTMDRPPVNALTRTLNDELTHALDRALGIVEACTTPEELLPAAMELARPGCRLALGRRLPFTRLAAAMEKAQ